MSAYDKVKAARDAKRLTAVDYINKMFGNSFFELHGDRRFGDDSPYINSGVLLMNLELLRREQDCGEVVKFIEKHKALLMLPDQDIISSLYGSRIYALDPFRYNMTERLFIMHSAFEKGLDLDWVRSHSVVIHYCGRNKPWKENYFGSLNVFYDEAVEKMTGNKELNK